MQVNKRNPMAKIVKTLQIWRALILTRKMQPETWNLARNPETWRTNKISEMGEG